MTELIDVVTSRGKAEILRLLFGADSAELHLRELVRRSGLSIGALQQELRRLARVGLVVGRRDGNRLYYRANPGHPLHADLRAIVLKTAGVAGVLRSALEDPRISIAFVFGSMARGDAKAESDIDLLVIGSLGLRPLTGLLSGAIERVGREINPHVLTPAEFRERRRRRDHFLTAVLEGPKLFVKGTEHDLEELGG